MSRGRLAEQAWQWLGRELDRWQQAGLQAEFWWRDDDAASAGAALDRLLELRAGTGLPLSLAVIPAALQPDLAPALRGQHALSVLQHGYAHRSHAARGQRKLELGGTRPWRETVDELKHGHQLLAQHFPESFVPVLVPPWNRIDPALVNRLPAIGLLGLSTVKARRQRHPAPGLLQVNAHLDPINWRHGGDFLGVYPSIAILVQHLVARRSGYRDRDEPSGILSHHLVQNRATWQFIEALLRFVDAHPAARFVSAGDIWRPSARNQAP